MSRFLAPIHSWLFNKIKLYEVLEDTLVKVYKDKYGEEIDSIIRPLRDRFGAPIEDRPLEDIIDTSNIHGWLQDKIARAETRQAAFLNDVFKKYGKEAEDIAFSLYGDQGFMCGNEVKEKYEPETPAKIYDAMNNYLLDGMPCDNVNNITTREENRLQWKNMKCLHRGYWDSVGADADTLYKLRYQWVKSFVEGANPKFKYTVNTVDMDGTPGFVHEIAEK